VFAALVAPICAVAAVPGPYLKSVQPLLARSCYGCHNAKLKTADLDLEQFRASAAVAGNFEIWEKVAERLENGTMPPKGIPRPVQTEIAATVSWIRGEIASAEKNTKPDPGRVTARRLNRAEYNNTIRDLLGVDFRPADDFPQDDSGYGFDNIGDVLSVSPVLLERYLKAAETAVRLALHGPEKLKPTVLRYQPPDRIFTLSPKPETEYDETGLSMPQALHATLRFPGEGDYIIRMALEGRRPNGSDPVHIGFWIDGKLVNSIDLTGNFDGGSLDLFGAQGEFRQHVTAGDHWIAASVMKMYEGLPASYGGPNPSQKKLEGARAMRNPIPANRVWVHYVEAMGPYEEKTGPERASLEKILVCGHLDGKHQPACARKIVEAFARRAFRRPVTEAELAPYLKLAGHGIEAPLEALLVSPDFLFRIESGDGAIGSFALATRLSYFLWSSTPDEELMRAAEQGTLRKPEVLAAQVRRMLKDPRSRALVENFAGQWLELRRLESVAPDREKFPAFDEYLRMSMRQETERFFESIVREDRSVLDLLDAKDTFLNEKLAKFYGISGVNGPEFRRVALTDPARGGVLTQASVLTVSSYATRTSPVLRGKWILENLLNSPIPPPPPNVPALDEAKIGAAGSMRTQMDEHRTNPACASCHSKMDPLGFAFENFDGIGHWRTQDGKFPIDASGTLPDGRTFNGPGELKALLGGDRAAFTECITEKLLTYALGRGLERYDRPVVKQIAQRTAAQDYRFTALVLGIVDSLPFQNRRGDRTK
jgi:hypothetical protein